MKKSAGLSNNLLGRKVTIGQGGFHLWLSPKQNFNWNPATHPDGPEDLEREGEIVATWIAENLIWIGVTTPSGRTFEICLKNVKVLEPGHVPNPLKKMIGGAPPKETP